MTTATDPRTAQEAHLAAIQKANEAFAKVAVYLVQESMNKNINWTNVGDVNYVAARLGEIVGFVNITEKDGE